ncbi:hypothetical protein V498_05511 [Pseudogymnoascus sp. VKM F-4517 (FW-2822)]|nr:hypothetical protein V498_05511 [Pseudogymnoascus sp. VKM F-4517 (FW-2822)]
MSFGFSVGDFLALGKLILDITNTLGDAGGSKSEYQELLRELESLNHALKHLDKLPANTRCPSLESIKYTALSCRLPLEQFLGKIQKYDRALGIWAGEANPVKNTADKLRWAFREKDEINKLQSYLNIHIGTINILLAEHGLERMNLASEKGELHQLHIRERLENTNSIMERIKDSVIAQAIVAQNNTSMLTTLFRMVSGELHSSLKSLGEMVAKVCVSTQQIYTVVLEIRGALNTPNAKWSFFQDPIIVEDALGFKFPVPSEYDYALLNAIIKHRFLEGPGSWHVQLGKYELLSAKNSQDIFSESVRLLPGSLIIMAVLLNKPTSTVYTDEMCPMPRCGSTRTISAPGGGRICEQCNVWFDHSTEKRKLDLFPSDIELNDDASSKDLSWSENIRRISKKVSGSGEILGCFKNVKLAEATLQDRFIQLMAEPIILASRLADLATLAFQASVALYRTVKSFNSHQERVQEFAREASALSGVLGSLAETIISTDRDLTTLEVPLRRCGKACEEFEQEIRKCSQRSGGSRASFRDWARLRYMGDDIDSFRRVLSGYKRTITIALSDASLQRSSLTLNTTIAELEERLRTVNKELDLIHGQKVTDSEQGASEVRRI